MKIRTAIIALSAASLIEFLGAYPVTVTEGRNQIEISNGEKTISIPIDDPNKTGNHLESLFYFLASDSDSVESVSEDWNFHVEREIELTKEAPAASLDDEKSFEFAPDSREAAILATNESLSDF